MKTDKRHYSYSGKSLTNLLGCYIKTQGDKMKPYYDDGKGIQIYLGDCRDILPNLPKVDLVLTDPPYGNNTEYDQYNDTKENLRELISDVFTEINRISNLTAITCGVGNMFLYPEPRWVMAWMTPAGSGSGPFGFCTWQPILCYGKDPYLSNGLGRRADSFIHTESSKKLGHPCAKPIVLWEKVMLRFSVRDTDIVLDPFMGSGTTLVASKNLGRKATGIDISEKYCEIAAQRLFQEVLPL